MIPRGKLIIFIAPALLCISVLPTDSAPDLSGEYYDWTKTCRPERPYVHQYHQTLVMKIFLSAKQPDDGCKVYLTFEQALDVIRKLDSLTCGIPKIVYLVGWQFDGHDSKYPSWSEVNHRLKRPSDAAAVDSLRWLMREAFKYNTTVSLHINMLDAYPDSPLWDIYVENDIIAKDKDGYCLPGETFDAGQQSYQISYKQEWDTGFARRRIDGLIEMLPIQKAGTIHIDAFHSKAPVRSNDDVISPYLGYTIEQEIETQRKIFRYWRDKGVDVTSEGSAYWLRPDPFVGLQPMAWHYTPVEGCPPQLYCGTPMQAEREIRNDPVNLSGLLEQFCLEAAPWHYHNNTSRLKGNQMVSQGGDVCIPALWKDRMLVAYSKTGYRSRKWKLPPGWEDVRYVDIYSVGVQPSVKLHTWLVSDGWLDLALHAGQAVKILPRGSSPDGGPTIHTK